MPEKWVVDASPVISLARIGKASLMVELCEELLIPSAVDAEINRGSKMILQNCGCKNIGRLLSEMLDQ